VTCVLLLGLAGCIDPADQRPGLRLSGEVVEEFPADWGFSDAHREVALEVSTPYLLPHSITIWCATAGDALYIGARNPDEKRWPGWVAERPEVRLKLGEQVYEAKLSLVDDPGQIALLSSAYADKYDLPDPRPEGGPPMRYWRVDPRS
jgi:hypothetical protein